MITNAITVLALAGIVSAVLADRDRKWLWPFVWAFFFWAAVLTVFRMFE